MSGAKGAVQQDLDRLIPLFEAAYLEPFAEGDAPRLAESMRYSLEAGGKRVRPVLCMLACESLGGTAEQALPCALALEYIHTYSLIHDDLPAMDDDDLRRGKPTNHVVFGEAMAILAGDGLLTEAFRILACAGSLAPTARVETVKVLAEAAGWKGMVGGQVLDMEGENLTRQGAAEDLSHLQRIHRLKTGALLRASLELGAVCGAADPAHRTALREAGGLLGMAFQIQDDILDATSTAEAMGKRVGKDAGRGKITYPSILGLAEARMALRAATDQALDLLSPLPRPESLMAWARYLAERTA